MITIMGLGTSLPGEPITNAKMEEIFSIRADWIDQIIGTKTRHFVVDLDDRNVKFQLVDVCYEAAVKALEAAQMKPEEIDFVVLSTATPDMILPATVNLVADKLGLQNIPTYQVQSGCSGALQGMDLAHRFLQSGEFKNALVIGGDVCYKYIDFNRDFKKMRSTEIINFALFGDGAGACILTNAPECPGIRIDKIVNRCEGVNREPGQMINWFGSHMDTEARDAKGKKLQVLREDYKAIETHVPRMAQEMIAELQATLNWPSSEVSHYLPPQLGGHMTDKIVNFLQIDPACAINIVADTGNVSNGLPYMQLEILASKMQAGEKAIGVAIESSKWIKTGIALSKE
ncbi:3-oxoacyl-ACP synthase III family protein [Tumebacillus permanentifrigoris]|uniref:3-oxoacyl-[acyl-carrier-protein] synthase-3 n=1 Tax=Tumebacillus permanentifrigoris TaxID=378543 RepID=A0A316DY11_9BACL|nr:3-oxoacyl-ACP synthase III family protein [Tumebacillus permanentifrigoris]PWK15001.1 3-oxoacyl-[acyl-carrier-protein] synthase-3 [Tumebacillus permanentifrigoris]